MTPTSSVDIARQLRDQAILAVEAAANDQWKQAATQAVKTVAARHRYFTTDQVWEELAETGLATRENRAMGAVMRRASIGLVAERTNMTCPSRRRCAHRRPLTIWQSLHQKWAAKA